MPNPMTLTAEAARMNAEEAHRLYARAWKVAPRSIPAGLISIPTQTADGRAFYWLGANWLPVDAALALCRTAAEDWLRADQSVSSVDLGDGEYPVRVCLYSGDSPRFAGPTIHHALVAAVEAVAAGKSVRA